MKYQELIIPRFDCILYLLLLLYKCSTCSSNNKTNSQQIVESGIKHHNPIGNPYSVFTLFKTISY